MAIFEKSTFIREHFADCAGKVAVVNYQPIVDADADFIAKLSQDMQKYRAQITYDQTKSKYEGYDVFDFEEAAIRFDFQDKSQGYMRVVDKYLTKLREISSVKVMYRKEVDIVEFVASELKSERIKKEASSQLDDEMAPRALDYMFTDIGTTEKVRDYVSRNAPFHTALFYHDKSS